jgi:hypothetical protein
LRARARLRREAGAAASDAVRAVCGDAVGFFDDRALRAIERENAIRLLPRLKALG